MKWRQGSIAALLAGAIVMPTTAVAQRMPETGWYIGGSIGQSEVQDFCDGIPGCDDTDTAWKVFGGYQINRNFALELGYTDLGTTKIDVSGPGGNLSARIDATALEFVGLGMVPIAERFSLYGKLGLYRGEVEGRGAGVVQGEPINLEGDDSNNDLTFGFGLKFDLTRNAAIRGEWQRYSDMGEDTDVDVLSIGLVWRF
jgi:OOP family OmpA-OmpF porin